MPLSRIGTKRAVGKAAFVTGRPKAGPKSYGTGAVTGGTFRKKMVPGKADKASNVAISKGVAPPPAKIAVGKMKGVASTGAAGPSASAPWDGGPADTDPIPKDAMADGGGGDGGEAPQAAESASNDDEDFEQAANQLLQDVAREEAAEAEENDSYEDDGATDNEDYSNVEYVDGSDQDVDERESEDAPPTYEGDPVTPNGPSVADGGISVPLQSSHVEKGILHTAALAFDMNGAHYVLVRIPCPCAFKGTVDFGADPPSKNPNVIGALNSAQKRTRQAIEKKAEYQKPVREIASIVNRARAGDQNAMALIAMVRKNAQMGNERAGHSLRLIRNYIDNHPVGPSMGSELVPRKSPDKLRSVLCLTRGPIINKMRLNTISSTFGNDAQRRAFGYGFKRWLLWNRPDFSGFVKKRIPPRYHSFIEAGATLGEARANQRLQDRNISVSEFNPKIGWELGE